MSRVSADNSAFSVSPTVTALLQRPQHPFDLLTSRLILSGSHSSDEGRKQGGPNMAPIEVPPDLVGQSSLYTHADPLLKR